MSQEQNNDIVGAIKVKDGLFIGDEFAAQVSLFSDLESYNMYEHRIGLRICGSQ